jgi:hypothetical protein
MRISSDAMSISSVFLALQRTASCDNEVTRPYSLGWEPDKVFQGIILTLRSLKSYNSFSIASGGVRNSRLL